MVSGTPLFDNHGNVTGSIGIHYNITERNETETNLKKSFNLVTEQNDRLLNFSNIVSNKLRSHSSRISTLLSSLKTSTIDSEKHEIIEHLNAVSSLLNETLSELKDDI